MKLLLISIALGVLIAFLFHFPMGLAWAWSVPFAAMSAMMAMGCFLILAFVR